MKNAMVSTNRGMATFIGRQDDGSFDFDHIWYEDFEVDGRWYTVAEHSAFTAYDENGNLICAYVEEV